MPCTRTHAMCTFSIIGSADMTLVFQLRSHDGIINFSAPTPGQLAYSNTSFGCQATANQTPTHTHTHSPCSTVIMASVVGGIGASSIVPLILATILAYCVTGYVRDELYHPFVKTCVGPFCNILVRNIGIGTMGFVPPNIQF